MSDVKWHRRLDHILERIERIENYIEGLSASEFYEDLKVSDAVERNLEVIGEASVHIPDDIKEQFLNIPWKKIKNFRNVVAHDYDRVNEDIVWETLKNRLPELKRGIVGMKKALGL